MHTLTVIFLLLATSLVAQPLKVMTFNIRYGNANDGDNRWENRKSKVSDLIKKYDPDIIGVQEALLHQLEDILHDTKGYEFFGVGRDDGKEKGEYSAILIRKNRFKILEQKTFWLSQTPEVPGSKHWDAAITRVVTWGKLEDKKSRKPFLMVNTHFDHVGKESRKQSAALLKRQAAALGDGLPIIITGDFNFTREQPPYEVMIDPEPVRLTDAGSAGTPGTACGFVVDARPCSAIDYIFHTQDWEAENYQVIQDHDGKYYPSDHLPVMVTLTLKK